MRLNLGLNTVKSLLTNSLIKDTIAKTSSLLGKDFPTIPRFLTIIVTVSLECLRALPHALHIAATLYLVYCTVKMKSNHNSQGVPSVGRI